MTSKQAQHLSPGDRFIHRNNRLVVVVTRPARTISEAFVAICVKYPEGSREEVDLIYRPDHVVTLVVDPRRPFVDELRDLVTRWRETAEPFVFEGEEYDSHDDEINDNIAEVLNNCAEQLEALLDPEVDTESSASRQHFIETGRYLRHGEEV